MKKLRLSRTLGLGGLAACLLLSAYARPEPVAEADPAEVARFLAELEAKEQANKEAMVSEARAREKERENRSTDRLKSFVESASKRSLSPATLNQVEETVVASLAG